VAGGDQPVVPGPDDDGVDDGVDGGVDGGDLVPDGDQSLCAGGVSGRRAPRMAKGRASPGKW
jgi:hypothetical protein